MWDVDDATVALLSFPKADLHFAVAMAWLPRLTYRMQIPAG